MLPNFLCWSVCVHARVRVRLRERVLRHATCAAIVPGVHRVAALTVPFESVPTAIKLDKAGGKGRC